MPVVEGNTAITATGEGMEDSTVSENPCTFVRPSSGPGRSSFCPGSRTGAAEGRRIPYPMVHGMKKSDEAGVPMKAANKGAKAPAELPEGRASTKGNSQDQSTYRTQGRVGVSQAVERIRQAATRKPQEKLTALLHHITTDALRCAFYDLKKTASAGVDGLVWTGYEDGLEERLLDLHGGAALLRWRPNQSLRRRRGRRQLDPSRRGEERRRVRWPTVLLSSATDGGLPLVLARFVRGLSTHQGSGCPRRLRTSATAAKCHRGPVDSHRVADQMPTGPSMSRRRAPHAASPLPRG